MAGVRDAVDEGANAAEDIHKRIANLPLDVLAQASALEETVEGVRKLQDRSIHAVYDLVRGINHQVIQLANDLLPPPRKAVRSRRKGAKGRKPARRSAAA